MSGVINANVTHRLDRVFKAPLYDDDTFLFNLGLDCAKTLAGGRAQVNEEGHNITFEPYQILPENILILLPLLHLRDLNILGRTCRLLNCQCTAELNRLLSAFFSSWGLSWIGVRFMLAQTEAILTGFFVYQPFFFRGYCGVDVKDLDIYVTRRKSVSSVWRHLEVAGEYEMDEEVDSPGMEMTKTVYYRLAGRHAHISVHHCYEEPRETVFRGQLTRGFSWMCSEGICVGYLDLTFACETVVSHSALSLGDGDYDRTLYQKLREVADMVPSHRAQDGFWGDIADDITWPRNSFDAMSFRYIFRHRVLSDTARSINVYWVLGVGHQEFSMSPRIRAGNTRGAKVIGVFRTEPLIYHMLLVLWGSANLWALREKKKVLVLPRTASALPTKCNEETPVKPPDAGKVKKGQLSERNRFEALERKDLHSSSMAAAAQNPASLAHVRNLFDHSVNLNPWTARC
ncbi:hypothetical protein K438DRAFT_1766375 [Mycena galopus ATCC 62051]|nr:hypothetical protein K438DRAFT_1766375 [Mycena galopus ATCC 62051]